MPEEALIDVALDPGDDSFADFQRRLASSTLGRAVSRPAGTTWADRD
jgi:hypothetical protein